MYNGYFVNYKLRVHGYNYFSRISSHKMEENVDTKIISWVRRDVDLVTKFWTLKNGVARDNVPHFQW